MDHGITPSALVTRLVADTLPTDIQVAMAAGLLTIGNKFMGTIAGCGALLEKGMASGLAADKWAAETVAEYMKAKRKFPGFGHPDYFPDDPRTVRTLRGRQTGRRFRRLHQPSQDTRSGNRETGRSPRSP